MRILIVVPSLVRAGAETQAVAVANGLSARGHDVHLCCYESTLDQRDELAPDVRFHHVVRRSKYDFTVGFRLADLIDKEKIEVVQCVLDLSMLLGWMAKVLSKNRPVVAGALHTTVPRNLKSRVLSRLLYRRVYRRLDGLIFVCRSQLDYWAGRFPELTSKSHVVYNGIDTAHFSSESVRQSADPVRRQLGIPITGFVFTCIAGFRPEKGHSILLSAFAQLPEEAHLVLVGDGPGRAASEEKTQELGIKSRVHFVGSLKDVRPTLVASNVTVLASTAVETFSMAMLESMSLNVPMIAPKIGGLQEAIQHGSTGWLFPVGDTQRLAELMRNAMLHPTDVEQIGATARRKVMAEFTQHAMVCETEAVLVSLVAARSDANGLG